LHFKGLSLQSEFGLLLRRNSQSFFQTFSRGPNYMMSLSSLSIDSNYMMSLNREFYKQLFFFTRCQETSHVNSKECNGTADQRVKWPSVNSGTETCSELPDVDNCSTSTSMQGAVCLWLEKDGWTLIQGWRLLPLRVTELTGARFLPQELLEAWPDGTDYLLCVPYGKGRRCRQVTIVKQRVDAACFHKGSSYQWWIDSRTSTCHADNSTA